MNNYITHYGFQIPKQLAVKTGTLPDFSYVSKRHFLNLVNIGELKPSDDVLDFGCGVGRDAIELTGYRTNTAKYYGIDIIYNSIRWAKENISTVYPNFQFIHLDLKNQQHNPNGRQEVSAVPLPIESGSIDFVFLFSVFTHMYPLDISYYLTEFNRLLRTGGKVLASFFLVDQEIQKHLKAIGGGGLRKLTFEHEITNGVYVNDPNIVPGATAYEMSIISQFCEEKRFRILRNCKGSWCKYHSHPDVQGQDIVLLQKVD